MALQNVVLASLVDFPASEARRVVFPSSAGGRQSDGSGFSPLDYREYLKSYRQLCFIGVRVWCWLFLHELIWDNNHGADKTRSYQGPEEANVLLWPWIAVAYTKNSLKILFIFHGTPLLCSFVVTIPCFYL